MTNRLLQRSQGSPSVEDTTTIAKRLETYYRASIPVIAYYETKTQLHKVKLFISLLQNETVTLLFSQKRGREKWEFWVKGSGN